MVADVVGYSRATNADEATVPADATTPNGRSVFRTVYEGKPSNREYLAQARREAREKASSWKALDAAFQEVTPDLDRQPSNRGVAFEVASLLPATDGGQQVGGGVFRRWIGQSRGRQPQGEQASGGEGGQSFPDENKSRSSHVHDS